MTTNGVEADLMATLKRADQRWASRQGDEPASSTYLEHLERYLRPHLGGSAEADAGEANDLRARLAAVERELAARTAAHDQLAGELQSARADLERSVAQLTAADAELERERDARARMADELKAATDQRAGEQQATANVVEEVEKHRSAAAVLRQKLRRATERLEQAERHVCQWEWPDPEQVPLPCVCGRPWPRLRDEEDAEDVEPELEPWDALWARLRVELADWGTGAAG